MKGLWRMFEAIFAGIMLITFLAFIAQYQAFSQPPSYSSLGYQSLKSLDEAGLLRNPASVGDYETINNSISLPGLSHTVRVCYESGCEGWIPDAENVHVASYIISGGIEIVLYMW